MNADGREGWKPSIALLKKSNACCPSFFLYFCSSLHMWIKMNPTNVKKKKKKNHICKMYKDGEKNIDNKHYFFKKHALITFKRVHNIFMD
jgi:hypothetical protein